jgi:glycosyltransferase involved in cell wall biosynthesis
MKKVCMVAYTYYPWDARIPKEAEALVQQGMKVDCFCLREEGNARLDILNGVNIYCLPMSKYRGSSTIKYMLSYILFFLLAFFTVSKFYFKRRYDVIQFHTLPDFIIFTGLIPKVFGARLILDMHEITPEFYMLKFGVSESHLLIRILKMLEKICVRFADAVIVVDDPIKRLLLQRCKFKSEPTVIMNCPDERLFCSDCLACFESPNSFSLIYHGTLTSLYGLEFAIHAVAKLKDRIPHLKFHIFGDEAEASNLKKLVEELDVCGNVIFMGRVPRDEIPRYLYQADIGVLPTIRGKFTDLTFSNKLAEYVCMKKPVVATRLKSALEYFPEDAIAYFESRNVDELASRVFELYKDPQKRLLQAEEAFQHYQKIRWEVMRKRYIELINLLSKQ